MHNKLIEWSCYISVDKSMSETACLSCPAACNVSTFNADLSYAKLSFDGIDALLSGQRDSIQRKYITSNQLQQRVVDTAMIDVLEHFFKNQLEVDKANEYWESKLEREQTSIVSRIEKALQRVVSMAEHDIHELFDDVSRYIVKYEMDFEIERIWMMEALNEYDILLRDGLLPMLPYWNRAINQTDLKEYSNKLHAGLKIVKKSKDFFQYYGDLSSFGLQHNNDSDTGPEQMSNNLTDMYAPKYAISGKTLQENCTAAILTWHMANQELFLNDLKMKLDNISSGEGNKSFSESTGISLRQFQRDIYDQHYKWKLLHDRVNECLTQYITFLRETSEWELKVHTELVYEPR